MATQWIDFAALKRQVPIDDVLRRYGLLTGLTDKKNGKLVGPCPIHGGKNSTSFHVDTRKNVFNCFSECGGGNVLDLVMRIENVEIRAAAEKLTGWFGLRFDRGTAKGGKSPPSPARHHPPDTEPTRAAPKAANPPLGRELKNLNADHPYLVERQLTVPTIQCFGLGFCNRGIMRGRIAIPIHDHSGQLVAYAGRAVDPDLADEKGKYRLPDGFRKSLVLFNLHRAREHSGGGLIVVEGFFGAMAVHSAGFPNVVALMGSDLSETQEELLLQHTDRLALMLDGDEAGNKCLRQFYARLRQKLYLREIHLEPGEQPDALRDDRIRELLS